MLALVRGFLTRAGLIATTLLAVGCGQGGTEAPDAAPGARTAFDPYTVHVEPELERWLRVEPVRMGDYRDIVRVPSTVTVDETRTTQLGASVTGRITGLSAVVGQDVRRGQTLAELSSTELASAQLALARAESDYALARAAADRGRSLLDADVIGELEYQRRKTDLAERQAQVSAHRDQLRVLGVPEAGIGRGNAGGMSSKTRVVASLDGTVIERQGAVGQVVQPAEPIYTVADLSRVWVRADVPEQQSPLVRAGDTVRIKLPALSDRVIEGRIVWVAAVVDPATRTVAARVELANPDRMLKPGMLAAMLIADAPRRVALVPKDSVVREMNRDFVFVRKAPGTFRMQEVQLGHETDGQRPVRSGVVEGDQVVVDGAFHLNNARKLAQQ
jgi:cobalt-zinc-cadmium efflux system membrane fusion protein